MELYEAHLILKAYKGGQYNAAQVLLRPYLLHAITEPAPYNHTYCMACSAVTYTCSSLPLAFGCGDCGANSMNGTQQYWVLHSNILFNFAKLSGADHAVVEEAIICLWRKYHLRNYVHE